ncbi:MAG: secretion protein HlyD, partial [Alphaproteobacteria bacterium]
MIKKAVVAIVLAAGVAGAGWYIFLADAPGDAGARVLYGNIDIRQVDLGFRVGGRIATLVFEEGDAVKSGTVLA